LAQHEALEYKPDRSLANKTGQIEKLTTGFIAEINAG
jgi:hypothetical protein